MKIQKIIEEKKKFIEDETGNNVIIEIDESKGACIDFSNWHNKRNLPKILHKSSVDKVHILHELVHLEKFFIDKYPIIAHNNPSLSAIDEIFKNIPEDYVAHKIIKYEYGFNPIEKSWFVGKDSLTSSDEQIAANLVNFRAFCKFCPKYKSKLNLFAKNCEQQKNAAFLIANGATEALEGMDYKKIDSYKQCAEKIIEVFAPSYYNNGIYVSYLSKDGDEWKLNL